MDKLFGRWVDYRSHLVSSWELHSLRRPIQGSAALYKGVAVHKLTAKVRDDVATQLKEDLLLRWTQGQSEASAPDKRGRAQEERGGAVRERKRPGRVQGAWSR